MTLRSALRPTDSTPRSIRPTVRAGSAVSALIACSIDSRSPCALAGPVLQHEGRVAGIADHAVVGAAVAEAQHAVGVGDQRMDRVERAVAVVGQRRQQQAAARRSRAAGRRRARPGACRRARRLGGDRVLRRFGS